MLVPSDCVAALSADIQRAALKFMAENFNAETAPAGKLDLGLLLCAKAA